MAAALCQRGKPDPDVKSTFCLELLQGMFLLRSSGLGREESQAILASTSNKLQCKDIATALQSQWKDNHLRERDERGRITVLMEDAKWALECAGDDWN